MPFPYPFRPFTKADIESLNPNQMGVYGIASATTWIYVGRGDIRERLLAHLNGDNACIIRSQPIRWTAIVTADHVKEEKALILELQPTCNQKVG